MTMLTPLTLLLVSAVSANIIDNSLESERTLEQDDNNSLQKAITYKSAGQKLESNLRSSFDYVANLQTAHQLNVDNIFQEIEFKKIFQSF